MRPPLPLLLALLPALAGFDRSGGHRWSKVLGGASSDAGLGIAASASSFVVTGQFTGPADLGGSVLGGAGSGDIFLLRLGP